MKLSEIKITPLLETLKLSKIDDETYFSECYRNYISNSRLGLLNPAQNGSVKAFFEGFKSIYSSSLDIGSAVHSITLQKDYFNIVTTVDKPTGKMGVMAEELFKIRKGDTPTAEEIKKIAKKIDYYGGNLSDNRIEEVKEKCENFWNSKKEYLQTREESQKVDLYLDPKSRETSLACIKALQNNKQIQKILHPNLYSEFPDTLIVDNEQAILLDIRVDMPEVKPFILRLKAKLDNYVIDTLENSIQVNDIKTLGRTVDQMKVNIDKYHYNREFAFYAYLLNLVSQKYYDLKNPTITGNYLVVSTIPQYYTKVVKMTKGMYLEGFREFVYLLKLAAYYTATEHQEFGIWI